MSRRLLVIGAVPSRTAPQTRCRRRSGDRAIEGGAIVGFANPLLRLYESERSRARRLNTLGVSTYRRALFQPISAGGNSIKKPVEQLEVEPQMPGLRVREGNAILRARFGRESRMGAVPSVLTLGVLLTAATVAAQPQPSLGWLQGPPPPVQPEGETNRVISKGLEAVGERYRGAPAYYNDGIYGDVIGVFFGLLAAGSYARARELRDGVCAAWRAMPRNGPFTGRAFVGGVDVDLDRMCGLER